MVNITVTTSSSGCSPFVSYTAVCVNHGVEHGFELYWYYYQYLVPGVLHYEVVFITFVAPRLFTCLSCRMSTTGRAKGQCQPGHATCFSFCLSLLPLLCLLPAGCYIRVGPTSSGDSSARTQRIHRRAPTRKYLVLIPRECTINMIYIYILNLFSTYYI